MTQQRVFSGEELSSEVFSSVDYRFAWTADGWYSYDRKAAEAAALKARNARMQELRKQGKRVVGFSLRNQLFTLGGVGTEHPEISVWGKAYGINWY